MKTSLSILPIISALILMNNHGLCQTQESIKKWNDSAQYYLELSQPAKALSFIKNQSSSISGNEGIRYYLVLGEIKEIEGYSAEALSNYTQALHLAKQQNTWAAQAHNGIASCQTTLDQLDSVLWHCHQSIRNDSSENNIMHVSLVLGRYFQSMNKDDEAMKHYQQAQHLATELSNKKGQGMAFSGIASIYFNEFGDMEQTLKYYDLALKAFDSVKHTHLIAHTFTRMANAYMVLNNGKKATHYLQKAKHIIDQTNNLPVRAYVLSSMAILKTETGDLNEVVKYAEQALLIRRQLGVKRKLQNDLLNLASWYVELNQYEKARKAITEVIDLAHELKDVVYLHYAYEDLAKLDSINGSYTDAYSHLKLAKFYNDSAYSIKKVKAIEDIKEKYQNEQKEKIIAEKELVIQQQKYQLSLIIAVAVCVLLTLLSFLLWRMNRHKVKLQIEQEKQSKLRLQTIIHTQEAVQQRIARDIHDGLVQVLGAAKLSLEAVNIQADKEIVQQRIHDASGILDEACVEARNISHQILPYSLMKAGLLPALDELLKKSLPVKYNFQRANADIRFNQDIEINLYRIAQELIQNIVKHSMATQVEVKLNVQGNALTLEVGDNGKGFDQFHQPTSAGLTNIKTRAQLMNAALHIDSRPGEGTKVKINTAI